MRKEESAARGQKLITDTAPDRSSYKQDDNKALMGGKMGGGPLDLSATLGGDNVGDGNYTEDAPESRKD